MAQRNLEGGFGDDALGPRSAYAGTLGVIKEGALADILLVDGDPIGNIKLFDDPAKNLVVIMKDGKIYKDVV